MSDKPAYSHKFLNFVQSDILKYADTFHASITHNISKSDKYLLCDIDETFSTPMENKNANPFPPTTPTKNISSYMKSRETPAAHKHTKFSDTELYGFPTQVPTWAPTSTNSPSLPVPLPLSWTYIYGKIPNSPPYMLVSPTVRYPLTLMLPYA